MANELTLIDFCTTPLRGKQVSLPSPLAGDLPVGLSSLSCNALLSYRSAPPGKLLSTIRNNTGADTGDLLTTGSDSDLHSGPNYSSYIAGVQASGLLTGTAASPFPAGPCFYDFDYVIPQTGNPSVVAFREANPFVPFQFGDSPFGFGQGNRPYPLINLGGQSFDGTFDALRIPFHNYESQLRIAVAPGGVPMTLFNNSGQLQWQFLANGTDFGSGFIDNQNNAHDVLMTLWECHPALTSFTGATEAGNLVFPFNVNEQPLPGFPRYYGYVDYGAVTMPGYNGTLGGVSYVVSPLRPFVVLYTTSDLTSVTLNGIPGQGFSFTGFTANYGNNNPVAATQAFFWDLSLLTNPLTFVYHAFGFTFPAVTHTMGTNGVAHYFEGFCRPIG